MESVKEKIAAISKEAEREKERCQTLKTAYERLVEANELAGRNLSDLKKQEEELAAETETSSDLYIQAMQKLAEKESQLDHNERELRLWEHKNLVLTEQIDRLDGKLNATEARCSEVINKLSDIEKQLEQKTIYQDEIYSKVAEIENKKKLLQKELDESTQEILRSERRLSFKSKNEGDSGSILKSYTEQAKHEEERAERLENQSRELSERAESLLENIENEQVKYKSLSTEIENLLQGIENL